MTKLQRIQNSAARAITFASKYQHITPVLQKLHWLPVKKRIEFKINLLTYKSLLNQQPTYLFQYLSTPSHKYSTRSASTGAVELSRGKNNSGTRAFSVAAPSLWAKLPPHVRTAPSLATFRSKLKYYLFNRIDPT